MKLRDYIESLTTDEREAYARKCGTTPDYMRIHILTARKEPRKPLREALARESDGNVSLLEVLQHFGMASEAA
ncbi:hypothetical protein [uncultured Gilvimarinus sp.]|uniref:hypothetical protein n=1 Tax=uncultured Gilvimarinus sp. TaxID=1689143 RepID=UPI0030ED89AB|tara:strand:+ start:8786 stop:9004 length:219 start_codon:yes stop_codon:yes gene_type:complete